MSKVTPEAFRARLYKAAKIDDKSLRKWLTDTGIGVGTAQTILPHDLNGRNSIPSVEKLAAISVVTGKSIEWLLGLDENKLDQTARARAAAGKNADDLMYIRDEFTTGMPLTFGLPRKWIAARLGVDVGPLTACAVHGDAMAPTLNDGDIVLTSNPPLRRRALEGLYVVHLREAVIIRRLHMTGVGRVQMLSDNPRYPVVDVRIGSDKHRAWQTTPQTVSADITKLEDHARDHGALYDLQDASQYLGFIAGPVEAVLSVVR